MAKQYKREEVLERLRKTIDEGKPIIGAGAGAGIVAKCCEMGGIDLIIVYSTGRSRMMGLPTSHVGDPNTITLELLPEILFVVKETPVIAGIHSRDFTRRMDELLKKYVELGCSGVINFPSVGSYGPEYIGGYHSSLKREADTMRLARDMDIFTMSYAYRMQEVPILAPVVDVIVPHAGWTVGGLVGFDKVTEEKALSLPEAAKVVQEMAIEAKKLNRDIVVLCHGGPISSPEDTAHIYEHTDAVGFLAGSSIERIPVEKALIDVTSEFKSKLIKKKLF